MMIPENHAAGQEKIAMQSLSRRDFLQTGLAAGLALPCTANAHAPAPPAPNIHEELLELAQKQQESRRRRFASVSSKAELEALQKDLRAKFLKLLDGLPERKGPPPARSMGKIDGDDYTIEKLVFESFPGYFVTALLCRPKKLDGKRPGIISPCGHSDVGKAAGSYQILHTNLAKRGYVVLTYDPVGQGERSQFWDAGKMRSRYNLSCGEHAVLGNPLYLLGTSLARYRIHDGMCAIDYLASLPEVDPERIGCVGNSGGGTLTAYISSLDPRVKVSVPSCYITTLPRRMGNRIQRDPDADPEQDIFGFVREGIDHAGLLALRVPLPTMVNAAKQDFFPIEGTRETCAEVKKLYEVAGAGEKFDIAEADEKHGLSLPLRQAAYGWFDRWLDGRKELRREEIPVTPRPAKELRVTADGQVNVSVKSRHLLPLALEAFRAAPPTPKLTLTAILRQPSERALSSLVRTLVDVPIKADAPHVICIDGNESKPWSEEKEFLQALGKQKIPVSQFDPSGIGGDRPKMEVKGKEYTDPLCGVEENIAYNAFLVGNSLLTIRVTEVVSSINNLRPLGRYILCARRDAALIACLAAALEPRISHVAVEDMLLSYLPLFEPDAPPINAASIVPNMLRDFGDIPDVLAAIAPRKVLAAGCRGKLPKPLASVQMSEKAFSSEPDQFVKWLQK
jgi:dienelactone hydrolase